MALAGAAPAATVAMAFSQAFSGSAPAGTAPWLTATFTDAGANEVRLELSAGGLSGAESLRGAYFNLDAALVPAGLTFAYISGSAGTQAGSITAGSDCCKADGDGRYDLLFAFASGSGFDAGETAAYRIVYAGAGTLRAASFAFLSSPSGGHGPFYAAAHVQNIGSESGWVAAQGYSFQEVSPVPLPAPLALLAAGLACLAGGGRRRAA